MLTNFASRSYDLIIYKEGKMLNFTSNFDQDNINPQRESTGLNDIWNLSGKNGVCITVKILIIIG